MLQSSNIQDIYALSPMQEGMLFHHLYDQASAAYFIQVSYRITGQLHIDYVQQSLQEVVRRHDILRTVFNYKKNGELLQVVLKDRELDFHYHDIQTLAGASAKEAFIGQYKEEDRQRSFDLTKDPLMRVHIIQLSPQEYEFIWSHHHILMDGWCMNILAREYFELYNGYVAGKPCNLPPATPYSRYIQWLSAQDRPAAHRYWSDYLAGYDKAASLPKRNIALPEGQPYSLDEISLEFDSGITSRLQALAAANKVTLNSLIQTLWGVVLARYNNTRDVLFGAVVAGRPAELPGVEDIVGLFINTNPVRIQYNSHTKFNDLLSTVQDRFLQSTPYSYLPLPDIQSASPLKNNLLDHILVFENHPRSSRQVAITDDGLMQEQLAISDLESHEQSNYHFNIIVFPQDTLTIKFFFNQSLFDRAMVSRLAQHVRHIAEQVLQNDETPVEQLSLLTQEERIQLLRHFNDTTTAIPAGKTLIDLFEQQAAHSAGKTALFLGGKQVSYQELNERSNQLAHYLRHHYGLKPDDLAGVMMDRSEWMIIAILGILKAGAGYVPIDPAYPDERKLFIITDAAVKCVLTDKELTLQEYNGCLDICHAWEQEIGQGATGNPAKINTSTSIAYVIYTSGSTGTPKGCMIEHGGAVNMILSLLKAFSVDGNDKILQFASLAFDASVYEIFSALLCGAGLVLVSRALLTEREAFLKYLEEQGVTVINVPPAFLGSLSIHELRFLRLIITAGQAAHVQDAVAAGEQVLYFNAYGPSECSVCVSAYRVGAADAAKTNIPIGKPIDNIQLYILDDQLELVPIGVEGELCISGIGLARGYLNRDELTRQKFIDNPFEPGTRLYRTGDRGRWREDGHIEYLGRHDEQVKLRGYRVELGEIEQVLAGYASIESAVVVARGEGADQYLVAYYKSKEAVDESGLRRHLSGKLPDYMVPTYLMQVAEWVLTASGKIDKNKLPDPVEAGVGQAIEYIAPRSTTEVKLVELWKSLLNRRTIGITDNLFHLGAHSVTAIRLAGAIGKAFGKQLALKEIFTHPTIESLARLLDGRSAGGWSAIPVAAPADTYPLSHAQKRLWIIDQLETGKAQSAYNIPGAYILQGKLNRTALAHAFEAVIDRHESLRTVFIVEAGEPRQKINTRQQTGYQLDYIDLRGQADAAQQARQYRQREAAQTFDLQQGPLIRTKLLHLDNEHYVFLLTLHHIISDEWSMEILVREVLHFYHCYTKGLQTDKKPLRIQYKDYAHWQQQLLTQDHGHRAYWLQQLGGELPVLELPTDFSRPPIRSNRGASTNRLLPAALQQQLKQLSHGHHTSLFVCMTALVNLLLYRYSGQRDIIIGTGTAGRDHIELEDQIGFYINTLALRTTIQDQDSFDTLLQRVAQVVLQGFAHQAYPLDRLLEEIEIVRDMSRMPLFDVIISYHNIELGTTEQYSIPGLSVTTYNEDNNISKYDLIFHVKETEEGMYLQLEYNTDLFRPQRMDLMLEHLENLCTAVVDDSQLPLEKLSYISEWEKNRLLTAFTATDREYPRDKTLTDLFQEQVSRTPDKAAIVCEDRTITYRELDERSTVIAAYLQHTYDLQRDDLVGLLTARSEWMIIGLLAILKAGAGYVPLDPESPAERLGYMLQDAAVKVLLTDTEHMFGEVTANHYRGPLYVLDLAEVQPVGEQVTPGASDSQATAYVIYTSGSTGLPKGCIIEHHSVINMIVDLARAFGITEQDRLLQFASVCFDASAYEIFTSLLYGCTLVLVSREQISDPQRFIDHLNSHQVSLLNVPPSFLATLPLEQLPSLRVIITAGQAADVAVAARASRQAAYYNAYGPTECAVCATFYQAGPADAGKQSIPIGKPLSNTKIYVLDEQSRLVPTGIRGEICISGAGVGRGYLRQPELTAQKFIDHPFAPGQRLYRTGDMGRWLPDGNIEYLGRKDEQLKVRGYRIEPGEIENVLTHYTGIESAVVVARQAGEAIQLAAYYKTRVMVEAAALRKYLEEKLPSYMVPVWLVEVGEYPLTASGKIDKKRLPDPLAPSEGEELYEAPAGQAEEQLAVIWREVLGRDRIGRNEAFFAAGGDSIRAIRIIAQVHRALGVSLTIADIFAHPTIADMASLVSSSRRQVYESIPLVDTAPHYPLSHGQKRLWIIDQVGTSHSAYNLSMSYELRGTVHEAALQAAFEKLIARHESLRTGFISVEGEPRQYILAVAACDFHIQRQDFRSADNPDESATQWAAQEIATVFQLEKAPLIRCSLLQLETDRFIILLTMHHIISDEWSMEVLIREALQLYHSYLDGSDPALPPLRVQYKDYTAWQQERILNNKEELEQYWLNQFQGELPVLDLPAAKVRPALKTFNGDHCTFSLDPHLTKAVKQLSSRYGVTPFVVLLAATKALLCRYTGQQDIVMGTAVAGRDHADLENQIGFYLNMLAIRTVFDAAAPFDKLLQQVSDNVLDAYRHQQYPFDELVEALALERKPSRSPLFDIGFDWHTNMEQAEEGQPGLAADGFNVPVRTAKYDLWLYGALSGDTISIAIEYNTHLLSSDWIAGFMGHYQTLLAGITANPHTIINELPCTTAAEQHLLLHEWNQTATTATPSPSVITLFEEQVRKTPDNVAVQFGSLQLTYQELNEQSNQLSAYLKSRYAVKPDELVGIMTDRSDLMIIAILGVLKSGAGYVPVDPAYPIEKNEHTIEDAGIPVMITDSANMFNEILLNTYKGGLVVLDIARQELEQYSAQNPDPVAAGSNIAYVIYTSGSTGKAKGCAIEHASLANYIAWASKYYLANLAKGDFALFSSLSFDFTVTAVFCPLVSGNRIVIFSQEMQVAEALAASFAAENDIDIVKLTPSHISLLDQLPVAETAIKLVIAGGEALTRKQVESVKQINPAIRVVNEYGPTEATVGCIIKDIDTTDEKILIGKPIDNTRVYITNSHGNIQPAFVHGEICISGLGLARGYLHQEALTREKFIANPFEPGQRLYRTGDIGRWLPNGNIEYIGRQDNQVKIKGYRIELGGIEEALCTYAGIEVATVITVGQEADKQLVAYFKATHAIETGELKRYLSRKLPDYMLPAYLVQVAEFPLTENGKLDTAQLPDPITLGIGAADTYVAPVGHQEEWLVPIWQQVLGRPRIGTLDNFFEIGGDSIRAIRLVAAINKQLSVSIEVKDIFSHQTIQSLAAFLGTQQQDDRSQHLEAVNSELSRLKEQAWQEGWIQASPEAVEDVYPMSAIEKGMLYYTLLEASSGIYHNQIYLQIEDKAFDPAAFEKALTLMQEKHSILRTGFVFTEKQELQVVYTPAAVQPDFAYADISGSSREQQVNYLDQYLLDDRARPFSISQPGLWRLRIFRLGDTSYGILLIVHHAIFDGWSDALFMTELSNIYYTLQKDTAHRPKPLQASYKDYIIDQLCYKKANGKELFWQRYLNEYKRTPLPLGKSGWNENPIRVERYSFRAGAASTGLSREQLAQVNLKQLHLATFCQLIRLTTGVNDIVVGLASNGRPPQEDGDKILGCFLNSVPFRVHKPFEKNNSAYLAAIGELMTESKHHDKLPLLEIAGLVDPLSRNANPIFDIIFDYLDFHVLGDSHEAAAVSSPIIEGYSVNNIPVNFQVEKTGSDFTVNVSYPAGLYTNREWARLEHYYNTIFGLLLNEPTKKIDNKAILAQEESVLLLQHFNNTSTAAAADTTVIELFEARVDTMPEATALVWENKQLSYRELNERSNQLAHYLQSRYGLQPDDLAGIMMDRSEWMIVSILAILKSGAGYIPVDPELPAGRIEYMLGHAGAKVLLIDSANMMSEASMGYTGDRFIPDISQQELENCSIKNTIRKGGSNNIAYVLYTSGSTGQPKGCVIEHRSLLNYLQWAIGYYFGEATPAHFGLFTSLSFDFTLTSIFCTLLSGGRLTLFSQSTSIQEVLTQSFAAGSGITAIKLTPSHLHILGSLPVLPGTIQLIIVGGEALTQQQVAIIRNIDPAIRIVNEYGPTEATVGCVVKEITTEQEKVLIGKPVHNMRIYIVDQQLQLVPIGVEGEIGISGIGLARGYLNRDELTRQKFIDNPFEPGTRLYRTGDRGRWREDGHIEYLGRHDEQVKLRGYRVELGEIEQVLAGYAPIESAVVVARGEAADRYLVAYYKSPQAVDESALRQYLSGKLPDYMVPTWFVQVEAYPLTVNGKLDKSKLPEPASAMEGQSYISPSNDTEAMLVKIWEEVLEVQGIGIKDNFFALGGHSIKAIRIVLLVARELQKQIELDDVFEKPTIEALASLLDGRSAGGWSAIPVAATADTYPLSHAQKRLWIIDQLETGKAQSAYNIPGAYILQGKLNRTALAHAFEAVIDRHESLRTVFIVEAGEPRQKIHTRQQTGYQLDYIDLRGQADAAQQARQYRQREAAQTFDLQQGPLIRTKLLHLDNEHYVFLLTLHHIISDEWSMEILVREVLHFYHCYTKGLQTDKKPLRIQYKDYAHWQQQLLTQDHGHRAYWLQQLGGELPVLELPTDFSRPPIRSNRGASTNRLLPAALQQQLKQLSHGHHTSLFVCMTALVNLLLYRYSGQRDIIIGTGTAGRDHIELEDQIGFYINTLALRTTIQDQDSFDTLLQRVAQVVLQGFAHQAYPLDRLLEEIEVVRDMSRMPLFDVIISYHNIELGTTEQYSIPGLSVTTYNEDNNISKYDLIFHVKETEEGMYLQLEYNTDLFRPQRMDLMLEHLENLCTAVVDDSQLPLEKLSYISEWEKNRLLTAFTATDREYPRDKTLTDLFAEQVSRTPDKTAIVCEDCTITYRELDERSTVIAAYLKQTYDLQRDDLVGLLTARSEWMIIGLLAILKAGAGYVPLDPESPAERVGYMLQDAAVKVLLTDTEHMFGEVTANHYRGPLYVLDLAEVQPVGEQVTPGASDSQATAYVIYTSGSTGLPKGCIIEHHSVINMALSQIAALNITENDRILQFASLAFDASVYEIFITLLSGAALVILNKQGVLEKDAFIPALRAQGVSVVALTAGFLSTLETSELTFLRAIVTGGEAANTQIAAALSRSTLYYNSYGPTECTVCITGYAVHPADSNRPSIPIGKPVSNMRVYITDEALNIVPQGTEGEICVSGAGLARGYLRREELTQQKFVANPFEPGARLYRTGDRGRWLEDGTIEFTGRKDSQVKIRGYRIELGEIENVLHTFEGITSPLVTALGEGAGQYLVAYFLGDKEINIPELKKHLEEKLPVYMVPAGFIQLGEFPLTVNGKIDRKKLPDPVLLAKEGLEKETAPRDSTEEQLLTIWQEVLGKPQIGIYDNFFMLGGYSLKAIQMAHQIFSVLQVKVDLRDIFAHPTIEGIARLVREKEVSVYEPIPAIAQQALYPLSQAQKRLWIVHQLGVAKEAYNMFGAFTLEGNLAVPYLEKAFNAVIDRHESLRTTFVTVSGEPYQQINTRAETGYQFNYIDLSDDPAGEQQAKQWSLAESAHPFDLATGPLIRTTLLQMTGNRFIFLLTLHHIISDGWSMEVLIKEILHLYDCYANNLLPATTPLRIQYKDYAAWQNRQLQEENITSYRNYWKDQLSGGIPLLELPADYQPGEHRLFTGSSVNAELSLETTQRLHAISQAQHTTVFVTLFTITNLLLYRYTGQQDITTGIVSNGRNHKDLENQVGFFVNMLPIRTGIDPDYSFRELLARVNNNIMEAYKYDSYPYIVLKEDLATAQAGLTGDLFNVLIQSDHTGGFMSGATASPRRLNVRQYAMTNQTTKFDLTFFYVISQEDNRIYFTIEYNTGLFKESTIVRMKNDLCQLFNTISGNEEVLVSDKSLLNYDTEEELFAGFAKPASELQ